MARSMLRPTLPIISYKSDNSFFFFEFLHFRQLKLAHCRNTQEGFLLRIERSTNRLLSRVEVSYLVTLSQGSPLPPVPGRLGFLPLDLACSVLLAEKKAFTVVNNERPFVARAPSKRGSCVVSEIILKPHGVRCTTILEKEKKNRKEANQCKGLYVLPMPT